MLLIDVVRGRLSTCKIELRNISPDRPSLNLSSVKVSFLLAAFNYTFHYQQPRGRLSVVNNRVGDLGFVD